MRGLLLLALLSAVAAQTRDLPDTCSGGGAFGLYRRESGCAIGNCDCFPVIYQCDAHLADGMGQCALSRIGWSLILLAFAINLLVPGIFFVSHYIMENAKDKAINAQDNHVLNSMDQSQTSHSQFYIDLRQFRTSVPDTAFGLRANPKIFMETMSKRWVQIVCYWLLVAGVGCFAILIPPVTMDQTAYPLTRQNTTVLNTTAYAIQSTSTNPLPGSTRFLSLQGDFCTVATDIFPPQGTFELRVDYTISFDVDETAIFSEVSGHKTLSCTCDGGQCALRRIEEGAAGAMPLVFFPWYEDAWHPFKATTGTHTFAVAATLALSSRDMIPFSPVRPLPHLLFLSHHSFMERVIDMVNLGVFLLDVAVLALWAAKVRRAPWLPERRLVHAMCLINLVSSAPVLYVSEYLELTTDFQRLLYVNEGVVAVCCGLWLLAFLFLLDMQRTRSFGCRFFAGKLLLGGATLGGYVAVYLVAADQYLSLLNFALAVFCSTIYHGLMVDVRNNLRAQPYATTRPEQLTARLLYTIGLLVVYVFFFVALFADPVPTIASYVPKTLILTDMAVQLVLRTATWVLAVLFLPPTTYTAHVYYTRARTKLPRITAANRDFTLAHLKQVVGGTGYSRALSLDDSTYVEWRAPDAFVVETACGLYNQSIAIYEEPVQAQEGGYNIPSHAHFAQDGLALVESFWDCRTDTYGWVLKGDKRVVVVFRGTLCAANAFTDLQVHMAVPRFASDEPLLDGIRLHAGFYAAYHTVQASVRRIVCAAMADMNDVQLYITGHSLGGALASIMAFDVATDATWALREEVVVYTYGSPRVGNHKFAQAFKRLVPNCYRVCADGDPIVGTPKRSLQALCFPHRAYKHVGNNVLLSTRAKGTFLINPNIVERAFISRLRVNAMAHFGPAYMQLLEKGVEFTKDAKGNANTRSLGEETPLLVDTV
ncbi:hypothetical protein ACHHYP_20681 [Achlya hypogyna]|uniref:Fungal lipase-type domain-containing protein n=1 Tax=Achlya hypogyna TaxID=1202772 RepID=A0A1V9YF38_ACHHY|nr:hypothetical protein ACHHYP_20681 [Achlya hypogyna]